MKELKSKEYYSQKKVGETKSVTTKSTACRCSCKCSDESAYTHPANTASDNSSVGQGPNPSCGCNHSANTFDYAKDMA